MVTPSFPQVTPASELLRLKSLNMKDVTERDMPEALAVMKDINKSCGECFHSIRALIAKVKDGPSTSQGISFLDVKNQLMSSYMTNLGFLMDKKTSSLSVQDDPAVDRLIEIRTVLEKMRPIEHKLKYQINKVVTTYKEGKMDASDPRKFRPNFGAFSTETDENLSDAETDNTGVSEGRSKLYVAPKFAPVHYSDDETQEERQKKTQEKTTKRAVSSAMLREMTEQYTDAPVEITESRDLHRIRENKRHREKTEFEENNFMRLSMSKKESAAMKKIGTMSALGAIAEFDDWDRINGDEAGTPKKKKGMAKKKKGKGFGKKGGGRRFKR